MQTEALSALTTQQQEVLNHVAGGLTISAAAERSGIHRNTINNWRRAIPLFADQLEFALEDQSQCRREQAMEDRPLALKAVHDILSDETSSPSVRLRAALSVLKLENNLPTVSRVGDRSSWPAPPELCIVQQNEIPAQSTVRLASQPGRNTLCPCGSNLKFKRCCSQKYPAAQPLAALAPPSGNPQN